jgi:hypothetical protein
MNPLIQSKNTTILPVLIALTLGCFGLSPQAQATCQQGCLPSENTALGEDALSSNTTGPFNTATGFQALFSNTTGDANVATGHLALSSNTTGGFNTATGVNALLSNTTGFENTATGVDALAVNTTGFQNTADGIFALNLNTTGYRNTATGFAALANNTTGRNNTADGLDALKNNTTGNNNIALGFEAGNKLFTGSNNIYIGSHGDFSQSRTIRIGDPSTHERTAIAGISGVTVAAGVGVIIDASGSARHGRLFGPLQGYDQADGQGKRSDPRAETGDLSLQERPRPCWCPAIRFGGRASGKGKSRSGGTG